MEVRCPHCFTPVELTTATRLSAITCLSCGSSFSLLGTDDTASYQLSARKTLGHFELIEQIGSGSFGSVWRARDAALDRTVAIKIPHKMRLDATESDLFLREARTAAQVRHPNLVSIHEVGREADTVYIVSEYVQGVTLAEWLTAKQMSPRSAAELCAKLAEAAHHAHDAGVVHRDLKPGNIMIDSAGEPHIMDFGLARREASDVTLTADGKVLGTPAYMSPEQAKGEAHHADRRSDVYSLGVILFELLTGERPFRGSARMLLQQILHDAPPSPRKLRGTVPRDLETICLQCLEKEPGKRYASAQELAVDLRRYLQGAPITARPITSLERAWRTCKRNPIAAGLLLALLLSLLGGLAGVTWQWRHARAVADERRRLLYISEMNVAQQAWEEATIPRLRNLLSRQMPAPGQEDLRSFEWWYLWRHASTSSHARPIRLPDGACQIAFSPDGAKLAVAHSFGPKVTLIDTAQATILETIGTDRRPRWSHNFVAFSPGGGLLTYPSADWRRVRLHNVKDSAASEMGFDDGPQILESLAASTTVSGTADRHFTFDAGQVTAAVFSPVSDAVLAIGDSHGVLRIGDIHTGRTTTAYRLHDAIHAVVFSPDGTMIGATSVQGELKVWDIARRQEKYSDLLDVSYNAIAFAPGGETLVSSGGEIVRVVNLKTGQRQQIKSPNVCALAFSPNGRLFATGSSDRTIRLWRTADAVALGELKGHFGTVRSLAFHPHRGILASASTDHTVLLWDLDGDGVANSIDTLQLDTPNISIALPPHGTSVAVSGSYEPGTIITDATSDSIQFRQCETLQQERTLRGEPGIISLAASVDGVIAAGGGRGHLAFWDLNGGTLKGAFSAGSAGLTALDFADDGTMIAVGDADGRLSVWQPSGSQVWTMQEAHNGLINSVAFSPDGEWLASGGWDGVARLWRVADGTSSLAHAIGFGCGIIRVEFAPVHGQVLAVGSQFLGIRLWNLKRPNEPPREIQTPTTALLFSPDGASLFSGGNDGLIKIWDPLTLDQRFTLKGHKTTVVGLVMSSDSKTLISCSWDKTVRFWRAASEELVAADQREN